MSFSTTLAFGADPDIATGDIQYNGRGQPLYTNGMDLLAQAIYRRLITPPGALLLHPEYGAGILSYVDRPLTPTLATQIQAIVTAQVGQDPRIAQVISVTVAQSMVPVPSLTITILAVTVASPQTVTIPLPPITTQ